MTTADSSCCDPQSPDDVPVISPPDLAAVLAAQDVTDVLLPEVTAPLVTISIEERALAPAAPLLRVPYLERLLEAVRDGTPLDRLPDALRPAVIQAHDDLATYTSQKLSWQCSMATNYAACQTSCSPSGALQTR